MRGERAGDVGPVLHGGGQERVGLGGGGRQDRLERGDQHAEQVQALGADGLQLRVGALLLGDHPRLLVVDVAVGFVGQGHGQAHGGGRVVALVRLADGGEGGDEAVVLGGIGQAVGQAAVEALADEAGAAAGQVDELAHQVGVDACGEVAQVQIEVFDAAAGLGGEVVAQGFGFQADVEVGAGHDEGATRLGHLAPSTIR